MRTKLFTILLIAAFGWSLGCAVAPDDGGKVPITTSSDEARDLFLKGRSLAEKLRGQEALQYFEQAVEEDPGFALAYLGLATNAPSAKAFFENLAKAEEHIANISEGEKLQIQAARAGADGDLAKQQRILLDLVAKYPDDERAHDALGNNYFFANQQYEKGIEQYRKATSINPEFSPSYNSMGYALRAIEKYDEAEKAFEKYIELIPEDPNPYDSYAELQMKIGKYEAAVENYEKALEKNENFVASYVGMATSYNYMGKYEKARQQLDKMMANAKNDGQRRGAHFAKAVSHVHEGNYDAAIAQVQAMYELAKKINDVPAMAGDLGTMGNILYEKGDYDAAEEKWQAAHDMIQASDQSEQNKENNLFGYKFNMARVALARDNVASAKTIADEAMTMAQKMNRNAFQIMAAHQLLGQIAIANEDYEGALKELSKANQQNPQVLYYMGMAYKGKGDKSKAEEWFNKAATFNALNSMPQAFVDNSQEIKMSMK